MNYQTFEMGTSDTAIPVIPFSDGKTRSVAISNPDDANGIGMIISRVDTIHRILEDKTVVEDKEVKPYLMLYFQNSSTIDVLINVLNTIKTSLSNKNK